MSTHKSQSDEHNHFVVSTPNIEKYNDRTHPQEIVSSLNELVSAAKEYPRQEAERYFDIGCVMAKSSSGLTIREMAQLLKTKTYILSRAKTVAERLDCDKEKFLKILDEVGRWSAVELRVLPPTKKNYKNLLANAFKNVRTITNELKKNPSDTNASASLLAMRDMMNRILPPAADIFDKNYLLYYPCVSCGVEAIEDGHTIKIHHTYDYLRYPYCEVCNKENRPPDMTRVAAMYASYAINTDQAYNQIMDYE